MLKKGPPCLICSGSKMIRLPVRRPVLAVRGAEPRSRSIDDSTRAYPCPECTTVPEYKLHIAGAVSSMRAKDLKQFPEARETAQRTATHNLVDYMLRHDLVQFSEQPALDCLDTTEIVAKLAVVTPDRITTLEQRVKEASAPMIARLVESAITKIYVWGSAFQTNTINKQDAANFIHEAAREVVK